MLTLTEIRTSYPHPRTSKGEPSTMHTGHYCVGGALCLTAGVPASFPGREFLAIGLQRLNPTLTWSKSLWYASRIIAKNDREDFERAWKWAERAIKRQGGQ